MICLSTLSSSSFEQTFALRPNLFEDYRQFEQLFAQETVLPHQIRDLCALRVATVLQCQAVLQRLGDLPQPAQGTALASCIEIAELFVQDPRLITDEMVASVSDHRGDAIVVSLIEWLALLACAGLGQLYRQCDLCRYADQ